jgi:uncharacterized protein YbbC (DUF1343 family)
MLADVDLMVFDIQDVGCRFYTYLYTLAYSLEVAARAGKPFCVLDRPNPIGGLAVEGGPITDEAASFVGGYGLPPRTGLTVGEYMTYLRGEYFPSARVEVIKLEGWRRSMFFEETGLPWLAPSPNIPSVQTALVYPGTCLFEGTNVSEGRGTGHPFEWIGAPWIDGRRLAAALEQRRVPGARFEPVDFVPRLIAGRTAAIKYRDQACSGVEIRVIDRRNLDPVAVAVHAIHAIRGLHGDRFEWRIPGIDQLYGSDSLRRDLDAGRTAEQIIESWSPGLEAFARARERYLLYP